jgi:hypothetical protein
MTTKKPGPRPEPVELKLLKGNPGRRPLPSGSVAEKPLDTPEPPAYLGPAGRDAWNIYWTHGKPWLAYTDIPLIRRICRLIDRAEAIEAAVDAEGLMHLNGETGRSAVHHSFNTVLGLYSRIADLEASAGFNPSERGRMNLKPATVDPLAEWQAQG